MDSRCGQVQELGQQATRGTPPAVSVTTRSRLVLAAVVAMVPLFFVDLGPWRRVFAPELHVFGHVAFFLLLGWLLMRSAALRPYRFPVRAGVVVLGSLVAGAAIELLQPYFGRGAGLQDLWQNLLGTALAVALSAPAGLPRRILGTAMAMILAVELHAAAAALFDRGIARIQFPVLSDFSTPFEHSRWSTGEPDDRFARIGQQSLRLDLEPARYAGTVRRRSFGDWSGYDALEFSIYNPADPLTITVTVRDREHFRRGGAYRDRFNRRFILRPGWNEVRIPIRDIREAPAERTLDLADLAELAIFTVKLEQQHTLYLDHVRVTR